MRLLGYTALSIQLLVRVTNVRASSELTLQGFVDPGATPTEASATPTEAAEQVCPECIVRQMLPPGELGLSVQQEAFMMSRLASQVSRLVDEAASELNKPHAEVFGSLEAVVRARGGRPRFDPSTLIDPIYTEEGKRLFGRMVDLFRKFVAAYVTAVAENGLGSETTAPLQVLPAKTESNAVSAESSLPTSTPSASLPLPPAAKIETKTETKTETKAETTHRATHKSSSTKSRSKSHSSDDDDDDDDDDKNDDEDDDDDEGDDKSDKRFKNNLKKDG
ncbi:hypothetical protein IW148_000293 [Coemansia sp. RSA 1199]|nr:hypothetical protein IW148_000293 [Coemansia sp. RSA 1199]